MLIGLLQVGAKVSSLCNFLLLLSHNPLYASALEVLYKKTDCTIVLHCPKTCYALFRTNKKNMKYCYFFLLLLCLGQVRLVACGYDFVGSCATHISLSINGTTGRFAIEPCNSETQFQSLQLGTIRTLAIAGAEVITWESCINNVAASSVYYRVYPVAQAGGTWGNFAVPEDYNTLEGPYTTRYRKANNNISLSSGLIVGTAYILEVYVRAEVDTLGDDFIPETFILKNNNGANYKLQFTYGGPAAPALVSVLTRKDNVLCWGKSTGVMGVTVFGGQPNGSLFYEWSAFTQNFFQIGDLPAGSYTVTVTESPSGNTATRSTQITQPQLPISLNFLNVTAATCATPGAATVTTSGGTGALSWVWSNSQTSATAQFPVSGDYAITVSDANACTQKGMVEIGGTGTAKIFEFPVICAGQAHLRGGQSFTQEGLYSVSVTAPNGCDSIVDFYLNVVEGANYLFNVANTAITCDNITTEVCAASGASAYTWSFNGALLNDTTHCLPVTQGGNYAASVTANENGKTCVFNKTFTVEEHLNPPLVTMSSTARILGICYQGQLQVVFKTASIEPNLSYAWYFNNDVLSTADSLVVEAVSGQALTGYYLIVTDAFGCKNTLTNFNYTISQPTTPLIYGVEQRTQCNGTIEATLQYLGGTDPTTITWSSGAVGNPVVLVPGFNAIQLTDAAGCTASVFVIIEEFSIEAAAQPASTASTPNGTASVEVKGAANSPVAYIWNNGGTSAELTGLLPGNYCVTVTESGGCTRTACATVEASSSTTQPFSQNNSLSLTPNPVSPGNSVFAEALKQGGTWNLIAPTGQICSEIILPQGQTTVPIPENLPNGIYLAMFRTDKFILTNKIFLNSPRY